MSDDVGAEVAAGLTEAEREAVLRAHVHISPAALVATVERIIAERVEAAKAEALREAAADIDAAQPDRWPNSARGAVLWLRDRAALDPENRREK